MTHGERAERNGHCGREYWSRRPGSGMGWGRTWKRVTHRIERLLRRREVRTELAEAADAVDPADERVTE